jgi:prepilin-type processing-associated H-X9-DG protein
VRSVAQVGIVVLIAVVLLGLFLPAISKVRDAAERMHCRNNLRQLGLSVHDYADTYRNFPRAAIPNPNLLPEERLSWVVDIVPFVESNNIYSKMAKKKGWQAEENRFAALLSLSYLHCKSYPEGPPVSTLAPTHYVGIAGIGPDAASLARTDPRAGFFGYERRLTLQDIRGRTSTLLVAAETSRAEGSWIAAGPATVRGLDPDGLPYLGGQFGGLHRKGTNALFADGSVRFIPPDVSPQVIEALAVLRGSEDLAPVGEER